MRPWEDNSDGVLKRQEIEQAGPVRRTGHGARRRILIWGVVLSPRVINNTDRFSRKGGADAAGHQFPATVLASPERWRSSAGREPAISNGAAHAVRGGNHLPIREKIPDVLHKESV